MSKLASQCFHAGHDDFFSSNAFNRFRLDLPIRHNGFGIASREELAPIAYAAGVVSVIP